MSHTDTEQTVKVEDIRKGEFVKRLDKSGEPRAKVFIRGDFDRSTGKYSLTDAEDVNREVLVPKGAVLFVGFTY